jgi:hypothetical protein
MKPTLGRIVHYRLNAGDVAAIDRNVPHAGANRNHVREGEVYPALVVRVFDPSVTTANLVVQLDGLAQYWATSRTEGDEPGHWSWPPRV